MRLHRLAGAFALAVAGLVVMPAAYPAQAADCSPQHGVPETGQLPWAQRRLDIATTWTYTRGAGVEVAVIDSGVDLSQPQMAQLNIAGRDNVIPGGTGVADCLGHGTAVTGIIAAPKIPGVAFAGVAPDVSVFVVKQTDTQSDQSGGAAGIARGIDDAVAAGASVINISVTTDATPQLQAALARAAAANVVIVAAAGNEGQGNNPVAYPAAYSTQFDNVLAVSAIDQNDQIGNFSETGNYVDVAAPGVNVEAPAPGSGYGYTFSGTSFAAPFVTGTVALVRAAHPELSAAQVVRRIEETADPPPASVPNSRYGYGIVDPSHAVTAVLDNASTSAPPLSLPALSAPRIAPAPDRHSRDLALGVAGILVGLAAVIVTAAVLRRATRRAIS